MSGVFGGGSSDTPEPPKPTPPPPTPQRSDPDVEAARQRRRRMSDRMEGRRGTLLSGGGNQYEKEGKTKLLGG